jgi:hypothetical protein
VKVYDIKQDRFLHERSEIIDHVVTEAAACLTYSERSQLGDMGRDGLMPKIMRRFLGRALRYDSKERIALTVLARQMWRAAR